ncbi:MurR/RpiR family transcriptional regulator [Enterococcus sp. 669A]|uniref:MurR/RpiR family transcriptional regulator n=1 Tax=Candidatus Enterococcus moelleringii TaxID=2815325 RepID=A0ABS3L7V0_9ENTE|nr:MurR/RpiR family transcriptional regulator [Enterococcus sp. 669A]MBO1305687.1 MurR/RpiR family transcriptional regulator [Enterococcus sp. 669A]
MDILMTIQKDYLNFSRQERKIADYILRFSHEIRNMKISELAKNTGTSNASITRFVKKIGCENYSDMKLYITAQIEPEETLPSQGVADDVFLYYQNVIKNTQRLFDQEKMDEFIRIVKQAKKIVLIGISSSGVTAETFGIRLMRMGLPAVSYSDPLWMLMQASIAEPEDLYFAISSSGTTDSIIETLERAKKRGSKIVSITSFSENPVSQLSDLSFHVYNTRFVDNEKFSNSQFSNVYLIDVITTYLLKDPDFKAHTFSTREVVGDD